MPEDIRDILTSLNKQVIQQYQQGNYAEALEMARQAYDFAQAQFTHKDPDRCMTTLNLGRLYYEMGDYQQAQALYQEGLAEQREALGEQHPDILSTMNNLASLYYQTDNYEQAEVLYLKVFNLRRTTLGEQHPDVATSLNNLGTLYYATGEYEQARQFLQRALEIQRVSLGTMHPNVALTLNSIAALEELLGEYEQALSCYEQALEIQRTTLGTEHPDVAKTLNNQAELSYQLADYKQAEERYQQALTIQRASWGTSHPDYATTLCNLAVLYTATGRYEQAEQFHQQALIIRKQLLGNADLNVATSLNGLAVLYQKQGKYRQAEDACRQALQIRRTILGDDHPEVARSYYVLGVIHYSTGDHEQAIVAYQQALEMQQAVLGEQHPEVAQTLNSIAVLMRDRGDYQQAEALHQQALQRQRSILGELHPDTATSLSNLAVLYREIGDDQRAKTYYEQALAIEQAILGEHHPDVATTLNNIAHLYVGWENYEQAETFYQQALSIHQAVQGEDHPDVATDLNNLAMLSYVTGNYEQALPLCRKALELQRTTLCEQHTDVAASLSNLAVLLYCLGEYGEAEDACRQALEIQRKLFGEHHPDVAGGMNNLAVIYAATGREGEALELMRQIAMIDNHVVEQVFTMSSERQRLAYLATLQGDLAAFLSLVIHYFPTSQQAIREVTNVVLRRKAMTIEVFAAQQEAMFAEGYPHLSSQFQDLINLRTQITEKELAGPAQGEGDDYQQQLDEWNTRKERLEAELARQIPEMRMNRSLQQVTHQTVARSLPPGSALLELIRVDIFHFKARPAHGESWWQPAHYLACVLLAEDPEQVHLLDLGDADTIDTMVATLRTAITGEREKHTPSDRTNREDVPASQQELVARHLLPVSLLSDSQSIQKGKALRRVIFDPLRAFLKGVTHLFLAPDGDLSRLPFEILPTDDGNYLIDSYLISYVGTGRDLLRFTQEPSRQPSPPLVIADPDFDLRVSSLATQVLSVAPQQQGELRTGQRNASVERLAGTQLEGQQVANVLHVAPLLAEVAVEARIKICHSPRILHIATHGFFLPDQPGSDKKVDAGAGGTNGRFERFLQRPVHNSLLRSGLILAGFNTWNRGEAVPVEAEDGLLTAEDVAGLDLFGTELVVLSACETGLGMVRVGEGVFGLRRAFVLAGARTLIMSLWKVPDLQTQELMADFYQRLLSGQPYAEALRDAQRVLKSRYAHPSLWGAFICQGAPGIPTRRENIR